jgi:hypothetical protein
VNNVHKAEISDREKYRIARQAAIRELLYHDGVFWNPRRCWEWEKYLVGGYGVIIFDGFKFSVHRLSFEHFKGIVPKGFDVMHDCDNPPCWNPAHLFTGTHADNVDDMMRKGRHASQRGMSLEEKANEPGLLRKVMNERENRSQWWRA